jgi:hypothetical protein
VGLKPGVFELTDTALKRRSSTVLQAFPIAIDALADV